MCLLRSLPLLCELAFVSIQILDFPQAKAADVEQPSLPNIVILLADDLGYGDVSSYGAKDLRTPHIDRLILEGMKFTNFYANCPVCSPTRAALLTGRYQDLVGVPGVIRTHPENSWGFLAKDAVLLPNLLHQHGYHSAIIGKWHLGLEAPNRPLDRGFNHFHGFLGDMMDDYFAHRRHDINYMRLGNDEIDPEGHATDLFTEWACKYIHERASTGRPFFLYLPYNAPHTPIQPPEGWLAQVKQRQPGITDKRAKLVALIEHMDAGVGKVLDALSETKVDQNTIVVFTSDNGGQLDVGANNGNLRDGKQSVYEGGIRVVGGVRWPGHIAAGSQTEQMVMTMDIFPTLLACAGIEAPANIDGVSFLPTLQGKSQPALRDLWFWSRREGGNAYAGKTIDAVRKGEWKLLQNSPFAPLELYNLQEDPLETKDLAKKNPGKFNELSADLRRQIQRYGSVPWQPQ